MPTPSCTVLGRPPRRRRRRSKHPPRATLSARGVTLPYPSAKKPRFSREKHEGQTKRVKFGRKRGLLVDRPGAQHGAGAKIRSFFGGKPLQKLGGDQVVAA